MSFFAVEYTYVDAADELTRVRPAHREFLGSLVAAGHLKASGPMPDTQPPSALLIMCADSPETVMDLLRADPFAEAGLIDAVTVRAWMPVMGCFAEEV